MYSSPNALSSNRGLRSIRLALLVLVAGSLLLAPLAPAAVCGFPTKEALNNKIASLKQQKMQADKKQQDANAKAQKHAPKIKSENHEIVRCGQSDRGTNYRGSCADTRKGYRQPALNAQNQQLQQASQARVESERVAAEIISLENCRDSGREDYCGYPSLSALSAAIRNLGDKVPGMEQSIRNLDLSIHDKTQQISVTDSEIRSVCDHYKVSTAKKGCTKDKQDIKDRLTKEVDKAKADKADVQSKLDWYNKKLQKMSQCEKVV